MSLLSLEKYLNAGRVPVAAEPTPPCPVSYLDFATRALSSIRRSVFVGEALADLSEDLEGIRRTLQVDSEQEAVTDCARQLEALLETFQQRAREAQQQQATDFRNILDILNEALAHLQAGNEKSSERLKHLGTGLARAAKIEDIAVLRNHLSKMLDYVRQEGKRDQGEAKAALEILGNRIRDAHSATSRFKGQLPGRTEALDSLKANLTPGSRTQESHAALFIADSLKAIRTRHGDDVAASILHEIGGKRIAALTADANVFCWCSNGILLLWQNDAAAAPGEILNRLETPLSQKAFTGTRMATFSVPIRSVAMPVMGVLDELVSALDRFANAGPAAC